MILEQLTVGEIVKGYRYDSENRKYHCISCGAAFREGEVYPAEGGRFLTAELAAEEHAGTAHGGRLAGLLYGDSKYITLTDNQKRMLEWIAAGKTDKEIAAVFGLAASTARHQRFMFREKAKQAKMYLAVYELAMEKGLDDLMVIHNDAVKTDERFVITEQEREKIIKGAFSSLKPLRLLRIPPKEKKKIVILGLIAESFEKGKIYTEKEINAILKDIYEDNVTLRRYLIEYGYLERKRDCSEYWVK